MAAPEALELADSVPQAVPGQPAPDRLQATPLFWASLATVATKFCVPTPAWTLAVEGVTVTEIAWIVEAPTPFATANPEALIKSAGFEELQITKFVTFCVEPSL
jgi:hypothetical protein